MALTLSFDAAKRERTLAERGLDFAECAKVFDGLHFTRADSRQDYGEPRFISVGTLDQRVVVIVWMPRGKTRRIISMRKANAREQAHYQAALARV